MQKIASRVILFFVLAFLLIPSASLARIGVGIGPGKIEFNDPVKPGGLYDLPPITVINTGDETGDYEVSIEYQDSLTKISPPKEWFIFTPQSFNLEPGKSQLVNIKANIPIKTIPGDYFVFLSAHPKEKSNTPGGTHVGISAAAKMSFTVEPANFISGIFYRLNSLWKRYAPWTYIVALLLLLAIIVVILRRFLTFNIGIGKKRKAKENQDASNKNEVSAEQHDISKLLSIALQEVEKYTNQLSENRLEEIFSEAKRRKQGITDFFYQGNPNVLHQISPELKQILLLSRNGMEKVRGRDKIAYEKILKTVVSGIIGQ